MKDFDEWNNQKKNIQENGTSKYYHPRDIWWSSLGLNIGFEQDGKDNKFLRPILILKAFGPDICLVVPLTTSPHKHTFRIPIGLIDGKEAKVILSQIKVMDTKRFVKKLEVLDKSIFQEIQKHIRNFF